MKSGLTYTLLALLFAILSLLLPAVAVTTMFAPTSDPTRSDASRGESPVETLKRRYAAGEIGQDEFDRRLDDLIEASSDARDRPDAESVERRGARDAELDSVQ
ncbi:SHOCT domain-containing protein [Halorussus pelagicus]|uniref:SHOCT domain-containing protein n=1 Tax=Halorussus pelagicus TaxID=2505977 RepID=UPI00140D9983|nr:SHOCT domain-containing protein [Halorussus pelagicus]